MLPVVLVVDDERPLLRLYRRILRSPHYEVLAVPDTTEALAVVAQYGDRIRLLVIDQLLLGTSGVKFAEELKVKFAQLEVLIVSGMVDLECEFETLEKPFSTEGLVRTVKRKLGLS